MRALGVAISMCAVCTTVSYAANPQKVGVKQPRSMVVSIDESAVGNKAESHIKYGPDGSIEQVVTQYAGTSPNSAVGGYSELLKGGSMNGHHGT